MLSIARRATIPQRRRSHGVVLPVVLVILVIITALVVTQVRRTTIDQRMAANAQESVALEAAAKAVLGWCEVEVQKANRGARRQRTPDQTALPAAGGGGLANRSQLGCLFLHARHRCAVLGGITAVPNA